MVIECSVVVAIRDQQTIQIDYVSSLIEQKAELLLLLESLREHPQLPGCGGLAGLVGT
jgi:hypothetical protein